MDYLLEAEVRMEDAIMALENRFVSIRAGRANPAMLSGISVEAYGAKSPINSIANISVPEARQLFIKPFDRSLLKEIERSINEANIGISPINNGEIIIITIPPLTEEKRRDYVKQIKALAEDAKISIRNIRQDTNNSVKKEDLPEDEEKGILEDVQDLVNKYNKIVDEKTKTKETELLEI